ncbi:hypothetical protein [Streptomyces prunicolor]|uniref:hypothetical protein n=1 Tax=Streptomyces prunicolor TaxID=67348 RepID=UPI0003823175|nr:hypothetical protein [Streptomyces prunicolor]
MSKKDVDQLIRKLRKQGFSVDGEGKKHHEVTRNGKFVTWLPKTPSDHRSLPNCMPYLKAFGYDPDPKRAKSRATKRKP